MTSFQSDWMEYRGFQRRGIFPEDSVAVNVWRELVEWLDSVNENTTIEEIESQLDRLRNFPKPAWKDRCPRVFISHKQIDVSEALRIANLASSSGFDFWLDVLDPSLGSLKGRSPSIRLAIVTAMIIEMALLNCTHVLAVMTPNTAASTWVPYEYGRAKERAISSSRSSAWVESTIARSIPDYLYLGVKHTTENSIVSWFRAELMTWPTTPSNCPPKPWSHSPTTPLP